MGGAHWHNQANTTVLSMCRGDVAFCQITFTICYCYHKVFYVLKRAVPNSYFLSIQSNMNSKTYYSPKYK